MKLIAVIILMSASAFAYAGTKTVREIEIRLAPSLYLNAEYGVVYSNTGDLPAELELLCEDDADPSQPFSSCGSIQVKLQVKAYGLSAYWLDYPRRNPVRIRLHVDPQEALLSDVLGSYIGGRAGAGLGLGARGMILVNSASGVFATTEQNLMPGDSHNPGVHIGIELSVPRLEIRYDGADSNKPLASFAI